MSSLSLARIMYGSNEQPAAADPMQPRSMRIQLPNLSMAASAATSRWIGRLFLVLFTQRRATASTSDSAKNVS
jgi:hypothetical protein